MTPTIGYRVEFDYVTLDPAVARIVSPAKYGVVTLVRGDMLMVRPDGETFSVSVSKDEIKATVQP